MTDLGKTIGHGIVAIVLFAIPALLAVHGTWQDMTLGGVLNAIYLHYVVLK